MSLVRQRQFLFCEDFAILLFVCLVYIVYCFIFIWLVPFFYFSLLLIAILFVGKLSYLCLYLTIATHTTVYWRFVNFVSSMFYFRCSTQLFHIEKAPNFSVIWTARLDIQSFKFHTWYKLGVWCIFGLMTDEAEDFFPHSRLRFLSASLMGNQGCMIHSNLQFTPSRSGE